LWKVSQGAAEISAPTTGSQSSREVKEKRVEWKKIKEGFPGGLEGSEEVVKA
jgi:hypothetical protein